jgi:uncharacterized protein with ACT and thioredoxin-like domain
MLPHNLRGVLESVDVLVVVSPNELAGYVQAVKLVKYFYSRVVMAIHALSRHRRRVEFLQYLIIR